MILCCLVTHYLSLYDYDWYCSLIGDLKYISYPSSVKMASAPWVPSTQKNMNPQKIISLFNVVVCVVRDSALAKLKLRESHLQHVASMYHPMKMLVLILSSQHLVYTIVLKKLHQILLKEP